MVYGQGGNGFLVRRLSIALVVGLTLAVIGCSTGAPSPPAPAPTATASDEPEPTGDTTVAELTTPTIDPVVALATETAAVTPPAISGTATRGAVTPSRPLSPQPVLVGEQTYNDPQGRFSFTLPGDWVQVQASGTVVAFQSPVPAGGAPASVNVILEKLPTGSISLDEYDQAGEETLRQIFPDYQPVSLTTVSIDGRRAYKRVFTATIANRPLQVQQVYLIDDRDVAYLVSCRAPQGTFAGYAAVFDQITGTFKVGERRANHQ